MSQARAEQGSRESQSWKAPQKHFSPSPRFHLIPEEIANQGGNTLSDITEVWRTAHFNSPPTPLYNHCIASTIQLTLDGASTHHPSFLSLPWASSRRASHIHLCPTFGESPSFLSGGRKMRLRLAAHRVQLLEKLKKPRPRCQGGPGLEESEASPDTTRRLRLPQDPNSSPPRFLRPCTKASLGSSWTGAIMLRRGVGKPIGCGISSAEKPPPSPDSKPPHTTPTPLPDAIFTAKWMESRKMP